MDDGLFTNAEGEEVEQTLLVVREAFAYEIPPRTTAGTTLARVPCRVGTLMPGPCSDVVWWLWRVPSISHRHLAPASVGGTDRLPGCGLGCGQVHLARTPARDVKGRLDVSLSELEPVGEVCVAASFANSSDLSQHVSDTERLPSDVGVGNLGHILSRPARWRPQCEHPQAPRHRQPPPSHTHTLILG